MIPALRSERGVAFCIYELGVRHSPLEVTADFVYVRLHGPQAPYQGAYSREAIQACAACTVLPEYNTPVLPGLPPVGQV